MISGSAAVRKGIQRMMMATPILIAAAVSGTAQAADFLLVGGQVYTPSGWVDAVAVQGDRIAAVGDGGTLKKRYPAITRIIDISGKTVIPGLHDMHVHPLGAGLSLQQCKFEQGSSPQQILDAVAACVKKARPGEWIVGGQWAASSFGDAPPTRQMLDRIAPDNPVSLTDISGHSAWVSSLALKAAGISRDTPNPEGGIIERDASGEPDGLLRESAAQLVRQHIPAPGAEKNVQALKTGIDALVSYGVTGLVDAVVTPDGLAAYQTLTARNQLKAHVRGCLVYGRTWGDNSGFDRIIADRARYTSDRFKLDCVKVFEDGVPTESHTAALIDPYAPDVHGQVKEPQRGLLLVQPAELDPLVTRLDKLGITVKFHAAGDQASRTALDAIAAARKANGPNGPTHDVGHLTFIQPEDMKRAKTIRATLEFSPYLWFPSPINDDIIKASGAERIKRVWPVREGIDSGALVVAGSDWSVIPSANPWIGIETLVTRKAPDGQRPGETYGPQEAITVKEAIDIFTINAARQFGYADSHGTIEAGKIADFIILDRNPFKIAVTDLHNVVVTQSYVGGELIYEK
jgi:predicted amidohydrolase YtcJ